jgi:hypothetical protein
MAPEDMATGFIRERTKIGSSLADVDPMNIDRSVSFLDLLHFDENSTFLVVGWRKISMENYISWFLLNALKMVMSRCTLFRSMI